MVFRHLADALSLMVSRPIDSFKVVPVSRMLAETQIQRGLVASARILLRRCADVLTEVRLLPFLSARFLCLTFVSGSRCGLLVWIGRRTGVEGVVGQRGSGLGGLVLTCAPSPHCFLLALFSSCPCNFPAYGPLSFMAGHTVIWLQR